MKFKLFSIISVLAVTNAIKLQKPCDPALEMSNKEMVKQMDLFSRTFDESYYNNAMKIYTSIKGQPGASVP